MIETLREPLLVLDGGLRVVMANRAFYRAFALEPEDTIARSLYELRGGQFNLPRLRSLLQDVLPQNTSFENVELACELPHQGQRTLLLNGRRVQREAGAADLVLLAIEDVTHAREVAAVQARLAAIVDGSQDAILSKSLDGTILSWNAGAERLYGYTAEEAVGQHISLIVPRERRPEVAQILDRVARGERVPPHDTVRIRRDGSHVEVSLAVSPIRDAEGRVSGASIIARDVTERNRLEQTRREAEELLQRIASASPAVLYTLDVRDGTVMPAWVSDNVSRVLGYSVPEALAADWWSNHVHPDDRADAVSRRATLTLSGSLAHEYRFRRKDDNIVWIRDEARVVPDTAGRVQQVVGSWTDTTERRLVEQRFLQLQKMDSVGRLAGGVAHDFNNLLTVIIGTADLALAGLPAIDPLSQKLKVVRDAAARGAELTRQLLAFARRQVFEPKVLSLNEVVENMAPMLRRVLGEDITLEIVAATDLGSVRLDPTQLHQVILNLAVNARDAMPAGGVLTVETANVHLDVAYVRSHAGATPGPFVMLAVSDTGVGMDEATRERLFEPFFTTKTLGRGTGLGLATVYGIVKQCGGNIWVYSERDIGTTFKIYFPRVAHGVAAPALERTPASEAVRGTETILLVEDEAPLRDVGRQILEAAGYTVITAGTPAEALLAAERHTGSIDLLITDVVMPRMRGPELAERVTRLQPRAKVLYVSGYAENAIVLHGELKAGARFLSKPFDVATLTGKVREALDERS
ncbi:MAG: PAS domain S-box protein [Acidobacteriota bacterium]